MQGVYKLTGTIGTVTTAKTLCYIETAATKPIEIYSARVTCENEDTSEQIYVELNRIATLGTPTATTDVPKPTEEGSSAYGGVCKVNVTASVVIEDDGPEAPAGVPVPGERPGASEHPGARVRPHDRTHHR